MERTARRNKEFEAAFEYVMEAYAEMFDESLLHIELVEASRHPSAFGQWTLLDDGQSTITVRNGRQSAAEFVDTLVHELTHLGHHVTGAKKMLSCDSQESEAIAAGNAARHEAFKKWPDGWAY